MIDLTDQDNPRILNMQIKSSQDNSYVISFKNKPLKENLSAKIIDYIYSIFTKTNKKEGGYFNQVVINEILCQRIYVETI